MRNDLLPRQGSLGLAASLVDQRAFTWACAGVTVGLLSLNLAGISLWPCPFHSFTGLPCPGCGLTRSGVCLLRGDLLGSLRYHAFGPLLTGIGLTGLAGSLLPTLQRRRLIEMLNRIDHRLHLTPAIFTGLIIYTLTRWIFDL